MEIGWICDTPYQIINCLAFVLSHSDKKDNFDLYIVHQFANSEKIEANIRKTGIFRSVNSFRLSGEEKGVAGYIKKCFRIISPKRWLQSSQISCDGICSIPKEYDILFVAVWTIWSVALYFSSNVKQVHFFEDGTGSYFRDLSGFQSGAKFVYRLLGRDLDRLNPCALYLNNPNLCQEKIDCPIYSLKGIMAIDSDSREKIYQAFDYKRDGYYTGYPIIYLTQPNDNNVPDMEEMDDKILTLLAGYGKDVLLRPHPRQKNSFQGDLFIDSHQDMWELVCADQITDSHVLVSVFSTAQITPKLLYNKEPYLILLYNLYPGLLPQMREEILGLIGQIRNVYTRPKKVFLPNTLEELKECIDYIAEDRCQNE